VNCQAMTAHLLSDHDWCQSFIDENNTLLKHSADVCASKLEAMMVCLCVCVEVKAKD
jgi:hypothetical protein